MNRQTNNRLRALDGQLNLIYRVAERVNQQQLRRARYRLARFEPPPNSSVTQREYAAHVYLLSIERETRVVQSMVDNISASGEYAGILIGNESRNTFHAGYRSGVTDISNQLQNVGIAVAVGTLSATALNSLYSGLYSALSYSSPAWMQQIVTDRQIGAFYYKRALRNLRNQTEITRRVRRQFAQAIARGESIQQIMSRLRGVTQGCRYRAIRIARTECLRALSQGSMISMYEARDMGIPIRKMWLATFDDRTRESHQHMGMEMAELDEPFSNGMMYPRDPNGAPEETINCRCVMVGSLQV